MLVARLYGAKDLRMGEEPVPVAEPGLSLVRVTALGVCGSDLHWYEDGGIGDARVGDRPLVLGHEFAGVIEGGPRHGERVTVDPNIACEVCALCRQGHPNLCPQVEFAGNWTCDGGLREYVVWPTSLLVPLPDSLSDVDGPLLEPLGVSIHALDLAHPRIGMSVAVIGCGPIGLMLIQAARAAGASFVRRQTRCRTGESPPSGWAPTRCGTSPRGVAKPASRVWTGWVWPDSASMWLSRPVGQTGRWTWRCGPPGPARGWCWPEYPATI